jgi:transcriptional regulator with XRE-family HTH domain
MTFEHQTDEEILQELATRLDFLRRKKAYTDQETAERGGVSVRTLVAFRRSKKDITLSSFIKLLRGIGELERLEALLPPAEPVFSPARQRFVEPPKRIRRKKPGAATADFTWGDEA